MNSNEVMADKKIVKFDRNLLIKMSNKSSGLMVQHGSIKPRRYTTDVAWE